MDSVAEGTKEGTEGIAAAIRIDPEQVRRHVDEVVRGTVEQTLNALLDAEADRLCNAGRYARSPDRQDTRAGSYERKLQTKAGEVNLKVPRLRKLPLETGIIERYRRRESSVEEALVEMYLAGVSMRRVEDITERQGFALRRRCGARGPAPARSARWPRRCTARSSSGWPGRSRASTRTCTWTASG